MLNGKGVLVAVIIFSVIAVVVYYTQSAPPSEFCAQVITSARNPATSEVREFPTPCDVPEGWDVLEGGGDETYTVDGVTWQKYRNADLGFSFEYRKNPDGYTMLEKSGDGTASTSPAKIFTLMNTKEYLELASSTTPREGPPSISVTIFNNPSRTSLDTWIKANTQWSLYNSRKNLATTTIGGAPVLSYSADGLYQNDVTVVDNNFKIYVIAGAYNDPQDAIRADFQKFLTSLVFF